MQQVAWMNSHCESIIPPTHHATSLATQLMYRDPLQTKLTLQHTTWMSSHCGESPHSPCNESGDSVHVQGPPVDWTHLAMYNMNELTLRWVTPLTMQWVWWLSACTGTPCRLNSLCSTGWGCSPLCARNRWSGRSRWGTGSRTPAGGCACRSAAPAKEQNNTRQHLDWFCHYVSYVCCYACACFTLLQCIKKKVICILTLADCVCMS